MLDEHWLQSRRGAAWFTLSARVRIRGICVGLKRRIMFNLRNSEVSLLAMLAPAVDAY